MVALRYGTPPIVHATGGLKDTVVDVTGDPVAGTGFAFEDASPQDLVEACDRFLEIFRSDGAAWEQLLDRGMAVDFDWRTSSTPAYVDAYQQAVAVRATLSSNALPT
jgi:starch synthase